MKRLYLVLALALLALGAVHTIVALGRLSPLSPSRVWFLCGGTVMLVTGALNVLNRSYGRTAGMGMRLTTVAANLVMLSSSILGGIATHATPLQFCLVVAVTGGLSLLSLSRRALC